jgi:N4-(beta-N-acetylglucosaminyl)-L-asparaginase
MTTRRDFVRKTAGAGLGALTLTSLPGCATPGESAVAAPAVHVGRVRPTAIASGNGVAAVAEAVRVIHAGGDTLDAVVAGVNIVELDPHDTSVGYGGLPNAEGIVQLDASVMHGPSRGAGAVAALEGVKTPSRVAVAVMRHTDHVLLVGEGARRFAARMGFDTNEELLTEESIRIWREWLERQSWAGIPHPWGTINCNAIDAQGNLSGCTTTSGRAFKLPGRVGDSPIVGAGLYLDNDVGAAGSTGRGEAVMKTLGGHTIVEKMRRGASPTDACLEACRRIVRWTVESNLLRPDGRPDFQVEYYALDKQGRHGGAALFAGGRYAVNVDGLAGTPDLAYLFDQ